LISNVVTESWKRPLKLLKDLIQLSCEWMADQPGVNTEYRSAWLFMVDLLLVYATGVSPEQKRHYKDFPALHR